MDLAGTHLNLAESSRRLFELDPGVELDAGAGWVFGAGRSPYPVLSNAAFRVDDQLGSGEFFERAQAFFATRNRGFAIWARGGIPADEDLCELESTIGVQRIYEMPEMVLDRPATEQPLAEGAELCRVEYPADAEDYWRVAGSAYTSLGFPPDAFAYYERHDDLQGERIAAFVARLGGNPVSVAMTIVSHGVAGIYWVGCTEEARGLGLGWAATAAAVNAGFELGAEIASLQASPMGEGLYRRMGFEKVLTYRLLFCSEPEGMRSGGST
jgi:ribosomal protein S18 acetylase RimI-like enzyme